MRDLYQSVSHMWYAVAMPPLPVMRICAYEKLAKIKCKQGIIQKNHGYLHLRVDKQLKI